MQAVNMRDYGSSENGRSRSRCSSADAIQSMGKRGCSSSENASSRSARVARRGGEGSRRWPSSPGADEARGGDSQGCGKKGRETATRRPSLDARKEVHVDGADDGLRKGEGSGRRMASISKKAEADDEVDGRHGEVRKGGEASSGQPLSVLKRKHAGKRTRFEGFGEGIKGSKRAQKYWTLIPRRGLPEARVGLERDQSRRGVSMLNGDRVVALGMVANIFSVVSTSCSFP